MRGKIALSALAMILAANVARAQKPQMPIPEDIYCSGMVTIQAVPTGTYVISGEQSSYKLTFGEGDYVYINKGSNQGVKVGDQFLVMRPTRDPIEIPWFTWQSRLLHAMGTPWQDVGRLNVVVTHPNVSIAQIVHSCTYMLRGDIVLPFAERPAPPLKPELKFDRFAPASGKALAMVVVSKRFQSEVGTDDVIYINLGSGQGVKVGDYFRIFRYQDREHETVFQTSGMATEVYGLGAAPGHWTWRDLPREILGEGIVLRTTPNASTVLVTYSLREIYMGDYVELE